MVLFFGLMRPYKGVDVLLDAWRARGPGRRRAVGRRDAADGPVVHPRRRTCDRAALRLGAELAGAFRAADLVVLPYREIDQSGVLFTALAFGKPLLLTPSAASRRSPAARSSSPPGDPDALAAALRALLGDPAQLDAWPRSRASRGRPYGWDAIAERTLALYAGLQA